MNIVYKSIALLLNHLTLNKIQETPAAIRMHISLNGAIYILVVMLSIN